MRLVGAVAGLLFAAGPASAQYYGPRPPVPIGPTSADDVAEIVQAMGLDPIGPPVRSGAFFVQRARDDFGRVLRVTVDARRSQVIAVEARRARECAVWPLCGLWALPPGTSGLCAVSAGRRGRSRSPGLDHGRARAAARGRANAALCCRDAAYAATPPQAVAPKPAAKSADRDAGAAQAPGCRAAGGRRIGRAGAGAERGTAPAAAASAAPRHRRVTPLE